MKAMIPTKTQKSMRLNLQFANKKIIWIKNLTMTKTIVIRPNKAQKIKKIT